MQQAQLQKTQTREADYEMQTTTLRETFERELPEDIQGMIFILI